MTRRPPRWWHPLAVGTLTTALAGALMAASPRPVTLGLDNARSIFPITLEAYRAWMRGTLPEWTDGFAAGSPLVGQALGGALYVPHLPGFVLTESPHLRAFDVSAALHAGLLAAGTFRLLVMLEAGGLAAMGSAVLAILSSFTLWTAIAFLPTYAAAAWWPWLLVAAEGLARPSSSALGATMALGWVALAAQVTVGFPEYAFYSGLTAAVWLLTRATPLAPWRRLLRLLLLGAGGLALAAPTLLPVASKAVASGRTSGGVGAGLVSLSVEQLAAVSGLTWPGAKAPRGFLGAVVLALGVVACGTRRPRAWFLAGTVLTAMAFALGEHTPFYRIVHAWPIFDLFRTPMKLLTLAELASAWLAGLGLARLWRSERRLVVGFAVLVAALAITERGAYIWLHHAAVFRAMTEGPNDVQALRATLATAGLTDLGRVGAPPPLVLDVAGGRHVGSFAGSVPTIDGIATTATGQLPLGSRRRRVLRRPMSAWNAEALDLFGIQALLLPPRHCGAYAARQRLPIRYRDEAVCVVENPARPGRYSLETNVARYASVNAMLEATRKRVGRPVTVVAMAGDLAGLRKQSEIGRTYVLRYEPGNVRLRVLSTTVSVLLVRHAWAPGWTATVDGKAARVLPAAGIYFAVPVPKGTHEVVLRYREPGLRAGLLIAAGWTLLAGIFGRMVHPTHERG